MYSEEIIPHKGAEVREENNSRLPLKRFIGIGSFLILALALPAFLVLVQNSQDVRQRASESTTYGDKIKTLADKVTENTFAADLLQNPSYQFQYGPLGLVCIPDAKLYKYYLGKDKIKAQKYKDRMIKIANYMYDHRDEDHNGTVGWGSPTAYTMDTGQTLSANTPDAYATGFATDCLIDAYGITNDAKYLTTVTDAYTAYGNFQATTIDPLCNNCLYFAPFMSEYSKNRRIKNRNLLMGAALSKMSARRNTALPQKAIQIYNAQKYEIVTRNNFGYAGYNDPLYSYYNFPESHIEFDLAKFDEIGTQLYGKADASILTSMWNTFVTCGDFCRGGEYQDSRTTVSCLLSKYGEPFTSDCKKQIDYFYNFPNKVTMYGLMGIIESLPTIGSLPAVIAPSPTPTPAPNMSVIPDTPTNLHTTIITLSAIGIMWNDTSNETNYVVEYGQLPSPTYSSINVGQDHNSTFITNLPQNTPMKIRIKACNSVGCSQPSAEINASAGVALSPTPTVQVISSTPTPTICLKNCLDTLMPTLTLTPTPILIITSTVTPTPTSYIIRRR